MKEKYSNADIEILSFEDSDIITVSPSDPNETPKMPMGTSGAFFDDNDPFEDFDISQ